MSAGPRRSEPRPNDARAAFDRAVNDWLYEERSWWRRQRDAARAWYHGLRLARTSWTTIAEQVVRGLLGASPPVLVWWYGAIGAAVAAAAFLALLLLQIVLAWLGERRRAEAARKDDVASATWVQIGDLLTAVGSQPHDPEKRMRRVEACLGLVEICARRIADPVRGRISVTVLTYDDPDQTTMTVRFRNTGNERPRGRRVVDLRVSLGTTPVRLRRGRSASMKSVASDSAPSSARRSNPQTTGPS